MDERRSAAGSGTLAGSGIVAVDKKVEDWRNIGVWASAGCILVVVGLLSRFNNIGCDGEAQMR